MRARLQALKQICRRMGVQRWPYKRGAGASPTGTRAASPVAAAMELGTAARVPIDAAPAGGVRSGGVHPPFPPTHPQPFYAAQDRDPALLDFHGGWHQHHHPGAAAQPSPMPPAAAARVAARPCWGPNSSSGSGRFEDTFEMDRMHSVDGGWGRQHAREATPRQSLHHNQAPGYGAGFAFQPLHTFQHTPEQGYRDGVGLPFQPLHTFQHTPEQGYSDGVGLPFQHKPEQGYVAGYGGGLPFQHMQRPPYLRAQGAPGTGSSGL